VGRSAMSIPVSGKTLEDEAVKMENEQTSMGPRLRVPLQTVPITRALAGTTPSDNVDGVGASSIRSVACSISAGMGSTACFTQASRCYDALYNHCMGN
jgi:hypothetical protein